jgi:hypothetical protein
MLTRDAARAQASAGANPADGDLQKSASAHANGYNCLGLQRHFVDCHTFNERRSTGLIERTIIAPWAPSSKTELGHLEAGIT